MHPNDCTCTENSTMCSSCVSTMNRLSKTMHKKRPDKEPGFNMSNDEILEQHPTAIKYPKQCGKFKETIEDMYKIMLNKNKDYSPANIVVMGEIGVLVRIWDKFCRLCNLYGISVPVVGPQLDNLLEEIKQGDTSKEYIITKLEQIKKESEFDFYNVQPKYPANEPVEDAWLDMGNYSIIGYLKRLGLWGR